MRISQLQPITEAVYRRESQVLQSLLNEEAELRSQLRKLENQRDLVRHDDANLEAMKRIGAELIWLEWTSRKKASLNIKLAQVLARKAKLVKQLRHAFGKKLVVEDLAAQELAELQNQKSIRQLDQSIQSLLFDVKQS